MFQKVEDLKSYVLENYPEVTAHRVDDNHWDLECTFCRVTRGFQVTKKVSSTKSLTYNSLSEDFDAPRIYEVRCPVCKAFKLWSVFEFQLNENGKWVYHYFRLNSLPSEGLEDIDELPAEPASLRTAYRQAIRCMDANAPLAAAAMFRRALQVITRQILGAKPGNLATELEQLVGKTYQEATITGSFAQNGYIVKEAGNQGAHPDEDPDLLDFTPQDAEDLQAIFMELVSELFVIPAAARKAKAEFLGRRKITPKHMSGDTTS